MALKKRFEWRRVLQECEWDVFTEEILPRLPANKLVTFKSVCKNWYRIISSPYFIGLHLKIYNQSRIRVLISWVPGTLTEYKINCDEEIGYRYPPEIREKTSRILGSCDGLLCLLLCRHRMIAVYNPSTGKYIKVQSPLQYDYFDFSTSCSWFGHHPCSGEYVLVSGDFQSEVGVYKFSNHRSNTILINIHSTSTSHPREVVGLYMDRVGTLLHGALHWPVFYFPSNAISVYHLHDNKHFMISPPVQHDYGLRDFKLGVAEGCLFAFFRAADYDAGVYELWIMKEYKLHHSWTKYANIEGFKNRVVTPLAFFPNGNLILYPKKSWLIIKYTFNHNSALLLMDYEYGVEAMMCPDSLLSPKIVGT